MSVQAGTLLTGLPSASWWKNSGCCATSTESRAVWLNTTSTITRSPFASAAAIRAAKSSSEPSAGSMAR